MPQRGPFAYSNLSWPQRFASLSASSILWYKRERETKDVIFRYGGFPNVPIIGTRGCINCNPTLLKRQLGYAMLSLPEDRDLVPFIVNNVGPLNSAMKIVKRAWTCIVIIYQEWGKKKILAKEPYFMWVKEQALFVKMPFLFDPSSFPLMPEPEPILQEDMDKITNKIRKLKLENTQLRVELSRAKQHNTVLEDKGKQVSEEFEVSKKRLREVEGKRVRVGSSLQGASFELDFRNNKLDQSYRTIKDLEKPVERYNTMKKEAREG